jgi:hypothetical protein
LAFGLLPNPLQKHRIKFTAVWIGEAAAAALSVCGAFGSRCNQPDRIARKPLKDSVVIGLLPVLNF